MLLYTKVAPPKVPKKRSRAGCVFCKEKKKKCDEVRPQCTRCAERQGECIYEEVRPRQRKKRESQHDDQTQAFEYVDPIDHRSSVSVTEVLDLANDHVTDESSTLFHDTDDDPGLQPDISWEWSSPENLNDEDGIIEEGDISPTSIVHIPRRQPPDFTNATYISLPSPADGFRGSPNFSEFSERFNRRRLVDHFCSILSHLIVFREESGNPFQQLVLPLAHKSVPVKNAMYALASAHLEYGGVDTGEKSLVFHSQAIHGLSQLIEKGQKSDIDEILAAIMVLVYYEVLVQKDRQSIADRHLKGALAILSQTTSEHTPTTRFLKRAFRFYDVITALSLGTAPLSTAPGTGTLQPFPPLDAPSASPMTGIDTLLGMATTLWPIMHRLSSLLALKTELERAKKKQKTSRQGQRAQEQTYSSSKIAVLSTEFASTSRAIEIALENWQPCLPPGVMMLDNYRLAYTADVVAQKGQNRDHSSVSSISSPPPIAPTTKDGDESKASNDALAPLQPILGNALAYRHSASVYLHRTIFGLPSTHPTVQKHTHLALERCVEVSTAERGPMSALLWPLFVAACEAQKESGDRDLAEKAFRGVERKQGMCNIGVAWRVLGAWWEKEDGKVGQETRGLGNVGGSKVYEEDERGEFEVEEEEQMGWRKVSREMGVNLVFG